MLNFGSSQHHASSPVALNFAFSQHNSHVALNLGFTNITHMLHWILHFPNIIHMLHWIWGLPTSFTCCTEFGIFPASFTYVALNLGFTNIIHMLHWIWHSPQQQHHGIPLFLHKMYLISHFLRCSFQTPIGPFKHCNDSMTLTACGCMQVSALLVIQLQLH